MIEFWRFLCVIFFKKDSCSALIGGLADRRTTSVLWSYKILIPHEVCVQKTKITKSWKLRNCSHFFRINAILSQFLCSNMDVCFRNRKRDGWLTWWSSNRLWSHRWLSYRWRISKTKTINAFTIGCEIRCLNPIKRELLNQPNVIPKNE